MSLGPGPEKALVPAARLPPGKATWLLLVAREVGKRNLSAAEWKKRLG